MTTHPECWLRALVLVALGTAACRESVATGPVGVTATGLALTATGTSLPLGGVAQLKATVTRSDKSTADVTADVAFGSAAPSLSPRSPTARNSTYRRPRRGAWTRPTSGLSRMRPATGAR